MNAFPLVHLMALIISSNSKRLSESTETRVRFLKLRPPIMDQVEVAVDTKFDVALESHRYGRLVRIEDYKHLDNADPVWHKPSPDNGELLARFLRDY